MSAVPSVGLLRFIVAEVAGEEAANRAVDQRLPLSRELDPFSVIEIEATVAQVMGLGWMPDLTHPDPTIFDVVAAFFAAELAADVRAGAWA